jgi:6-phospho-3-hexuloisomerase
MPDHPDMPTRATRAATEIAKAAAAIDPAAFDRLVEALATARRIAITGAGREGLMMRALAMRLYHLGLDVHVVGDMTCPPLGPDDLLFVSAGPGDLSTITALVTTARAAGAKTLCLTAQPDGPTARAATQTVHLPAQTMASDQGASPSILPMGSVFEGAMFLIFELVVLALCDRLGTTPAGMRARHTNLE